MDVRCESCSAQYKVDDAKIPAQGIKAKCPKCGHSFFLKKPEAAAPPPEPPPLPDFAGDGDGGGAIAIEGDQGAAPMAPSPIAGAFGGADPFGGSNPFGAAPAAPMSDPFAGGGFGGTPQLGGFGGGAGGPAPAADPFGSGGVFGGGGFGGGGFDAPPPGEAAGIGGLFNAKTAFEIQRKDGQQIGPFDMFTLKQMIYEQQLDGSEMLNDSTGSWVPIASIEELGEIFRLTGAGGAPAASSSADGGGWGDPSPAVPSGGGWQKHESVAAPAPAARPSNAPVVGPDLSEPAPIPIKKGGKNPPVGSIGGPAVAPAPIPVSLDAGAKRSMSERVIILTENLWALSKKKSVRIALGIIGGLALISVLGWVFRAPLLAAFGLDKRMDASRMIAEGDRTMTSGERGPLLGAMASYEAAVARFPEGADGLARLAEVQALLWQRDPSRLDMKAAAEANLAKAAAESPNEASVQRATARLAIGRRDAAAADAALAKVGGEGAIADPILPFMRGEIAYLKGDLAAADAAWSAAAQGPMAGQANAWVARARAERADFPGAKTAAETALKTEPDNGLAQVLLAFSSAKTGGDAAAAKKTLIDVLGSAQRSAVERARAAFYLSVLSEEAGATGAALGYVRSAVQLYPSDADSVAAAKRLFAARFPDKTVDPWIAAISRVRGSTAMLKVQEGEAQYALRNWQGALSPLLAAANEDPASARAQYALGRLLVDVGGQETAKAKAHFEKALVLDPDYAEAAVALSRWELAAGNAEGARAAADKAIAADPTLPGGYQAAGSAALAAKDPATAETFLVTATDLDPDSYLTWLDLGEARRLAGRPDDALAALMQAAKLRPDVAGPKVSIGMAWELKGDFKQALEFLEAAAAIEPANPNIAARVGITHVKAGNYLEGKKKLEVVVKANPQIAEAQYYLGVAHQFSGDPEKAIDDYRQAIKFKYEDAYLAHYHLGEIFGSAGTSRDPDAARSHLDEALKLKPDYYQAHEELAKILKAERMFAEALKALRDVETAIANKPKAERDPVLERVIIAQGNIAKEEGRNGQATELFRKVVKLYPRSHEAHYNLGELVKDTSPGAAKKHYRDAINANRTYAPPYKVIGYMEKDSGSCRMAKSYWTTFVGLSAPPEEIKEIEQELSNLDC